MSTTTPAYIPDPVCIQGAASSGTITSDPRPVFEAPLVFKARLVFEEIRYIVTFSNCSRTVSVSGAGIMKVVTYSSSCVESIVL